MSSVPERQRVDRELSSELIESPINPAFLHVSAPLKNDYQIFFLHINGEALWQWRGIKRRDQMFQVLQDNLFQIGYRLSSCCENRVGLTVYSRVIARFDMLLQRDFLTTEYSKLGLLYVLTN